MSQYLIEDRDTDGALYGTTPCEHQDLMTTLESMGVEPYLRSYSKGNGGMSRSNLTGKVYYIKWYPVPSTPEPTF